MHGRSHVGEYRGWLTALALVGVVIGLLAWNLRSAEAAANDAQQAVIPGTDLSGLRNANMEWDTKNQHRIWSNGSRWDAVLPTSVDSGAGSASEWWIVKGATTGNPQFNVAVSADPRHRPDVYWDAETEELYVLMSGGASTTFYRFSYDGTNYSLVGGPTNVPGMATSSSRAAIYKSESGHIWVSMMHGGGLRVSRSDDNGATWPAEPTTLMIPLDEGQTQMAEVDVNGQNHLAIVAAEDGQPPFDNERAPAYWLFAFPENAAGWNTADLAQTTLTIAAQPADGDSLTIGANTYTFKAALTGAAGEVKIGANLQETQNNLVAAIWGDDGAGEIYSEQTLGHPDVVIDDFPASNQVDLAARVVGEAGNSIVTTGTGSLATAFAGPTLTGGSSGGWVVERRDVQSSTGQTHADDEVSIVTDTDGNLYIASETDRRGEPTGIQNDPQVILLRRTSGGAWSQIDIKKDQQQQHLDRKRPVVTISGSTLFVFTVDIAQSESSYWSAPLGNLNSLIGQARTPFVDVDSESFRNHIVPRGPVAGTVPVLLDNLQDLTVWKAIVPRSSANQPPAVELGEPKVVSIGSPATLTPVIAFDDNVGGTTIWTWSKVSGPGTVTFSPVNPTSSPFSTKATFSATGDYVIRLTATETGTNPLSNYDEVAVHVQPVNKAPTLTIQNPKNGEEFTVGALISFQATASDPEAGNITGDIRWTSDRDGFLGAGSPVIRSDLSKGTHKITASVSDGQNQKSASVTIVVGSPSGPGGPGSPGGPGGPGGPSGPGGSGGTLDNPFKDDNGHVFESDIEWLANAGITRGCNPPVNDRFCPDDHVTRGQMAAFLVRAFGYTDNGGGNKFVDDNGHVFEGDIDRLATAGVTRGCNPPANDRFCPDDRVTRGQMAAFLVRAFGYSDNGGGNKFVDDNGHVFEGDIDRLATAGVTRGCNPPTNDRFCPDDFVTRGQMAAFLHRALGD